MKVYKIVIKYFIDSTLYFGKDSWYSSFIGSVRDVRVFDSLSFFTEADCYSLICALGKYYDGSSCQLKTIFFLISLETVIQVAELALDQFLLYFL